MCMIVQCAMEEAVQLTSQLIQHTLSHILNDTLLYHASDAVIHGIYVRTVGRLNVMIGGLT